MQGDGEAALFLEALWVCPAGGGLGPGGEGSFGTSLRAVDADLGRMLPLALHQAEVPHSFTTEELALFMQKALRS